MNVSRFFGITNREAMRQVRLALGPDALIISNRRVEGGVEIMAADPHEISEGSGAGASSAAAPSPGAASPGAAPSAAPPHRPPTPAVPPLRTPPAPVPSPMSPLGAYAAAFRAAYGPVTESAPAQPSAPAPRPQPQPAPGEPSPNILDAL